MALCVESRDDKVGVARAQQYLDGNLSADWLELLSQIDYAHATLAERPDDSVGTEPNRTLGEFHRCAERQPVVSGDGAVSHGFVSSRTLRF